jgi:sec-independent protein translocase protein TatB
MFDIGFGELVLLFVIGLLVLGPQKLPKVAAEIGKWVGRARRTATQLRRQLEREIELSEIQPPPPPAPQPQPQPSPPSQDERPVGSQSDAEVVSPTGERIPSTGSGDAPPTAVADPGAEPKPVDELPRDKSAAS